MMKRALVFSAWMACAAAAHGQAYPSKPVRVVCPFPAGTSTDVIAREVAQILTKASGQTYFVENKPGAQGTIAADFVAHAPADGYTLLLGNNTTQAAAKALVKNIQYDPAKDFEPIARIGLIPQVLAVRPDLPVKTARELVDYGKAHPGKLRWGYANAANQIAGGALVRDAGLDAIPVPYKGVPQMLVDLAGGVIDFTVADPTNVIPMAKGGKLRPLAVTTADEIPLLPGVPSMSKTVKGFTLLAWFGLFAPRGLPADIRDTLSKQVVAGVADPAVQARMANVGVEPFAGDSGVLRDFVASETVKWTSLIAATGIQPE
ncbi:tripartite tricarboxylate transporter substrate binding protein [Pigmentiphaga soli]|uniref:Tripartite tricarboxylate transporter substrate binding protein n=1 Tax=Pigmentiphaga soli TaxID=1007095 RepID=A0ABP8H195_9BURK